MNDPTKTGKLRSAFRAECTRRIASFLRPIRQALVDQDFLGVNRLQVPHPMLLSHSLRKPPDLGTKLQVLTNYVNQVAYSVLVQEGAWLQPHAERAFEHGMNYGTRWSKKQCSECVQDVYLFFYRNELEGIADATVQQVARVVGQAILKGEKPHTLYQRIVQVTRKITEPRMFMLVNQIVVQQHNLGRIEQIRLAGWTHFGVIAETKPAIMRDHFRDQEELVNILTAGDELVCEECEDYAAGGPYELDEVEIPLHPRCRCAVVPFEDERFRTNIEAIEEFLAEGLEFEELE